MESRGWWWRKLGLKLLVVVEDADGVKRLVEVEEVGGDKWVGEGCRELLDNPEAVRDKAVLEVGSGTGLCGVFAAKLGAMQVCPPPLPLPHP
jgi:Lysine methyltransferase